MIKYNPRIRKQKCLFKDFYRNYINELKQYSKRLQMQTFTEMSLLEEIYNIENNPEIKIYFLTNENNIAIGFLMLGFNENKHPKADWYIQEFYIQPNARKQGYGKNAVKEMLEKHPGMYCYYILKENKPAQIFWNKMRKTFNCIDVKNDLICFDTPYDCIFEAFTYIDTKVEEEGN